MTASEYKLKSRRGQCAACGEEHWFKQERNNLTHWISQKAGCSAWFKQVDFGEPSGPAVDYDWLNGDEDIQPEPEYLSETEPEDLLEESSMVPSPPSSLAPVNLAPVLDLTVPLEDRTQALMGLLKYAAAALVERDADENPEAYADPDFLRQEVAKRTLKEITDLGTMVNTLEVTWALEHEEEVWYDEDGREVSLGDVIESQMPDEEQRKSSGRARQLWAFKTNAVPAFRAAGISDQRIAQCRKTGIKSVLDIVSSAVNKLQRAAEEGDLDVEVLPERYDQLIQAASETVTLQGLKKEIKGILDPSYEPPPTITCAIEHDGDKMCWFLAWTTEDQYTETILGSLGDVLEFKSTLFQDAVNYWNSFINVPAGQMGKE